MVVPVGCIFCCCAQNRVYERFLSTPFSIQTVRFSGKPSTSNGIASRSGSAGSEIERHALVHDFLADPRAAARLRKCAAAFVGGARVQRAREQRNEIVHRLRLEHGRHGPCRRSACGLRLDSAFRAAARPMAAGSIFPQSRDPALAQPLPVPSGVLAVIDRSASVVR